MFMKCPRMLNSVLSLQRHRSTRFSLTPPLTYFPIRSFTTLDSTEYKRRLTRFLCPR